MEEIPEVSPKKQRWRVKESEGNSIKGDMKKKYIVQHKL